MIIMSYYSLSSAKNTNSSASVNNIMVSNTSKLINNRQIYQYTHRVRWLCFNTSEEYDCCQMKIMKNNCLRSGPTMPYRYCATYSEKNSMRSLSIAKCPYLQSSHYNATTSGHILLPVSLTELNDYMCDPLNRKGIVCGECADGFGPSVTSYGNKCANCTNTWYHIPLFLFAHFVPLTVLYIIILVFRISVVSPPIPCFIMYAQFVVFEFDLYNDTLFNNSHNLIFTNEGDIRLDMKILHTFYGLFNQVDIFHYVLPPLCLSSNLKQIHVVFLVGYISVLYPIVLIFLTWVCVRLHDYNFKPFVWLWRPFHRCFVRLHNQWDIKSDLVDAFITFFLLSYSKSSYQALVLLSRRVIDTVDQSGVVSKRYCSSVDPTIDYLGYTHRPFAVIALLMFIFFNILPPLLLALYPFRAFRRCLSKFRVDFIAVNIFADKIHSCYRNGLDGGRDMRSFSGLYYYLLIGLTAITTAFFKVALSCKNIWFSIGVGAQIMVIILVIAKPYQKMCMNHMDTLLLMCLALQYFSMSTKLFQITKIFLFIPMVALCLMITVKVFNKHVRFFKTILCMRCDFCRLRNFLNATEHTHTDNTDVYCTAAVQPLIQPTCSEMNYGTK